MHESYTTLIDRLEQARAELLDEFKPLSQNELDQQPADGGWSAGEVLQHLAKTEHVIAIMIARGVRRLRGEHSVEMTTGRSLPSRFNDAGIETGALRLQTTAPLEPAYGTPRDDVFAALSRSRAALLDALESAGGLDVSALRIPHPVFGELDPHEWLDFLWRHELRHREQIRRALV